MDINVAALSTKRRPVARPCLDWSERESHLAGSLGAALFEKMLASDWIRKTMHSRVIIFTGLGEKKLYQILNPSL
jgi:hypothetical protein